MLNDIISVAYNRLSSKYPFYAYLFSRNMVKIADETLPAPMGVAWKNKKINLYYNPRMIREMGMNQIEISDILYHEIRHVVNGDVFMKERKGMRWNVAMDLVINKDILDTATKYGVTVDKVNKQFNIQMEEGKTSGYYYYSLPRTPEANQMDDHSKFEESDSSDADKEELSQTIRETFESFKKNAGQISEGLLEELDGHLKSKVNWKKQFRNIISNALNVTRKKTRSRVNRRLGWALQGVKKDDLFKIVFCVDTSGSMSTESLSQCWAELKAIHKTYNCSITVIEADSEVKAVKEFNPKAMPAFSGRGGTNYSSAIEEAKKHNPDVIAYYGDFDCADTPTDPKVPFLWVGVGKQKPPADFGKVIYIE